MRVAHRCNWVQVGGVVGQPGFWKPGVAEEAQVLVAGGKELSGVLH